MAEKITEMLRAVLELEAALKIINIKSISKADIEIELFMNEKIQFLIQTIKADFIKGLKYPEVENE